MPFILVRRICRITAGFVCVLATLVLAGTGTLFPSAYAADGNADMRGITSKDIHITYDHGGIVRGDNRTKSLALIFTAGDRAEGAPHILDVLRQAKVKASFFVTGNYLVNPDYQTLVRRMIADGHYVGPHSHAHLMYCKWHDREKTLITEAMFRTDLERNLADLRCLGALPRGQEVYFIPPYESYNEDQSRWARGMHVVLFNLTPGTGSNRDWIPEGHPGFVSSEVIARDILTYEKS